MNKDTKWLILSLVGFVFFMGLMVASLDFNFLGIREWRGNKAVLSAVFIAGGAAWSICAIIIQTWKIQNSYGSKLGGVLLAATLVVVGAFTTVLVFPDKSPNALFKQRENQANIIAFKPPVYNYVHKVMYPSIWASLGGVIKECLAKENSISEDVKLVSDVNTNGEITNIDFVPKNSTSSCVAAGLSKLHVPSFTCKCTTLPIALYLKVNSATASVTDADLNPTEANSRYVIREDTVYDMKTDLTWQRCSVGQHWIDGMGCDGDARVFTFDEAQKLADASWRLPTKDELMSLVDQNRKDKNLNPAVDVIAFPDMDMKAPSYWSSTPNWTVHLGGGVSFEGTMRVMPFAVILVRN
jgi:hypothetical protein